MVKSNILDSGYKFREMLIKEKLNAENVLGFIAIEEYYIAEMVDDGKEYYYAIYIDFVDVLHFVLLDTKLTGLNTVAKDFIDNELYNYEYLDKLQNNNISSENVLKLLNTVYHYVINNMNSFVIFQALKSEPSRIKLYDMIYRLLDKERYIDGIFKGNFKSEDELHEFNLEHDVYVPEELYDDKEYKLYVMKDVEREEIVLEESKYFSILDKNKYSNDKYIRDYCGRINEKLIKEIKNEEV